MSDRLTQTQEAINQQAENFTNSIGTIHDIVAHIYETEEDLKNYNPDQNDDKKIYLENSDQLQASISIFSQLIGRTSKDIEELINSLPSEDSSDQQVETIKELEQSNNKVGKQLEDAVSRGEVVLREIRAVLHELSQEKISNGTMQTSV